MGRFLLVLGAQSVLSITRIGPKYYITAERRVSTKLFTQEDFRFTLKTISEVLLIES